uniref:F-actin-capping protein subunit beta n=1 Tax=Dicyema japonicum TaxID=399803 RepID=B9ZYV2_DICJA|nr:F-actin capping protein beta [Dicyema japonicum]BAJ09729.1 F-actin capping protein beta [Dicyema japonicum]
MSKKEIECALDLCRRLPPQNINKIMCDIIKLKPDICEPLLALVDRPLTIRKDSDGKEFLTCDYNRDADSYRSPWNNEYTDEYKGLLPSQELRELEVRFNEVFTAYTDLYYGGAYSSVYLWDMEKKDVNNFGGAILIKKIGGGSNKMVSGWDSIHIFEANKSGSKCQYKLVSSIMLWMQLSNTVGINLGGSLIKEMNQTMSLPNLQSHLSNVGSMVENQENSMRGSLSSVYFEKTLHIMNTLRQTVPKKERDRQNAVIGDLAKALARKSSESSPKSSDQY